MALTVCWILSSLRKDEDKGSFHHILTEQHTGGRLPSKGYMCCEGFRLYSKCTGMSLKGAAI